MAVRGNNVRDQEQRKAKRIHIAQNKASQLFDLTEISYLAENVSGK